MPDLSKITLPSGSTYDLKDAIARQMISQLNQFTYEVVSELPTASASTMYKIYLVAASTPGTQDTYEEYITIDKGASASPRYIWEKFGTITPPDLTDYAKWSDLGALATKDSASGSGTVAVPKTYTTTTTTATTESKSVSVSGTTTGSVSLTKGKVEIKTKDSGTNSYTPAGTITVKTAGGTTNVTGIDSVGTLPSATMPTYTVSNEVLTITGGSFSAGTLPTKATAVACKTSDPAYNFSGTAAYLETASEVGTGASFTGSSMTSTGSVTVPKTFSSETTTATTENKTVNVTVS